MSVSHETTESSSSFWTFPFGDNHSAPPEPSADVPIIVSQVPGLQGEAHQLDLPKGRELVIQATYSGYETEAALRTAVRLDNHKLANGAGTGLGTLRGELLVNSVSYGNATFLGVTMVGTPQRNGVDGLWFCDAILRWRLRS